MVSFLMYYGHLLIDLRALLCTICIILRLELSARPQIWYPLGRMYLGTVLYSSIVFLIFILITYRRCAKLFLSKSNLWTLFSICLRQVSLLSRIIPKYFVSQPNWTGKCQVMWQSLNLLIRLLKKFWFETFN